VPSKIVLKVGFIERDFERDHLAEKSNRTKMGQKIHCACALLETNKHAESESEGFSKSEIFGLGLGRPKSSSGTRVQTLEDLNQ
jgi:hypothetical protein